MDSAQRHEGGQVDHYFHQGDWTWIDLFPLLSLGQLHGLRSSSLCLQPFSFRLSNLQASS